MNYVWDRIDYTTKAVCDAGCGKALTRGIAYIVVDENGNELHCGSVCAENKVGSPKPKDLPNITLNEPSGDAGSSSSQNGAVSSDVHSIKKEALEYLLLRYHFNDCSKVYHKNIQDWYDRKSSLTDDEYNHIVNTKKKLHGQKLLSAMFLKKVLKIEHELRLKIKDSPNAKEFMLSIIAKIHKDMSLSEKQNKGVKKWFDEDGIDLDVIPLSTFVKS